jgi:histidinol dehydrogenase
MTAPLAKIAGCPEVVAFTPSNAEGGSRTVFWQRSTSRVSTEIYRIGGVQAVGAMAYGTVTLRAVDKIFGPGNAYVCEAKRQVFGTVGVDSLPGPE